MEKLSKISKIEAELGLYNRYPENASLSKEIYDLVGIAHRSSPEELRNKLTEIADRVANLERKSRTDELTGLLNREGFYEEVKQMKAIFMRERQDNNIKVPTALMMIDLDGFKEVNDTCGHACGDRCLSLIAEHVKDTLRESDVFARIGGDEFSIFIIDEEDGAVRVAGKVRSVIEGIVTETIRQEFPTYKGSLSASIGVVPLDGNGTIDGESIGVEEVMRRADYVAYVVKAAGKSGELTLNGAREVDSDGQYQRDFLAKKTLVR